jgi:hypothetical protein
MCVRLTRQLAVRGDEDDARSSALGPAILAGLVAAFGLTFAGGFITSSALGYSEGLMTALVLIAVDRHLDGCHRQAFAVGFAAALDRPEIWLFWGPYGLWLFWKDPGARKLVIALFVLIPILWFLPEYWGSGHFFRGVTRAHTPRSNSAAFAKCPFCTEFAKHAWPTVPSRTKGVAILAGLAAAIGLWRAFRAGGRAALATPRRQAMAGIAIAAALGFGWWVVISVMTQIGFSGNDRYLILASAGRRSSSATGCRAGSARGPGDWHPASARGPWRARSARASCCCRSGSVASSTFARSTRRSSTRRICVRTSRRPWRRLAVRLACCVVARS